MKCSKLISCVLSLALIAVCFCGCQNKKETEKNNTSSEYAVKIAALAEQGKIPELPFSIGDSVERVKTEFKSTIEPGSEIEDISVVEGEKTVWLDGGAMLFCYEKANSEKGISLLVAKENAYGFSLGGVIPPEDIVSAMGTAEYTRAAATEQDAFFLPVIPDNCECLTYKTGNNVLRFIFTDGYLSAVSLTNPQNWQS